MRKKFSTSRLCSASPEDKTTYNKSKKAYYDNATIANPQHEEVIKALSKNEIGKGNIIFTITAKPIKVNPKTLYMRLFGKFVKVDNSDIPTLKSMNINLYESINGEYVPYSY